MKSLRMMVLVLGLMGVALAQTPASSKNTSDDVIMTALKQEMGRAKEKLQLGTQQKPYFIQYSVNDSDDYVSSSTFGAPFGGTTRGGHQVFDPSAVSLITPPNSGGGGGSCLPSIVIVALGEPGVPLICWAMAPGK